MAIPRHKALPYFLIHIITQLPKQQVIICTCMHDVLDNYNPKLMMSFSMMQVIICTCMHVVLDKLMMSFSMMTLAMMSLVMMSFVMTSFSLYISPPPMQPTLILCVDAVVAITIVCSDWLHLSQTHSLMNTTRRNIRAHTHSSSTIHDN